MPAEEIEDRFFKIYSQLSEHRDMIYTTWEMLERLRTQVQAMTDASYRGGRHKRTVRTSRK